MCIKGVSISRQVLRFKSIMKTSAESSCHKKCCINRIWSLLHTEVCRVDWVSCLSPCLLLLCGFGCLVVLRFFYGCTKRERGRLVKQLQTCESPFFLLNKCWPSCFKSGRSHIHLVHCWEQISLTSVLTVAFLSDLTAYSDALKKDEEQGQ